MKRLLAALLLAAAVPAITAGVAEAKCAQSVLVDTFLVKDSKGAIVVGTQGVPNVFEPLGDLTFTVDGKKATFEKVVHAPGLIAYRLPAGAKKGVAAGKKDKATVAPLDASTAALPAPKVKSVLHENHQGGRGSSERTTVTLDGDPPADAIAIVITDADGKALSWGSVTKGEALSPYWRGRCGVLPDGTESPDNKKTVKLFWVDKFGRASAMSASVKLVVKRDGDKYAP